MPPAPPTRGGSVLTTVPQQAPQPSIPSIFRSDEFDDFSAKFESKVQPKTTGNAFLDSLAEEKPSTADAWGDSDTFGETATTTENCFATEEDGFDTWDPPVVPESTPYMTRRMSNGSDEVGKDFSVVIKPKGAAIDYGNAGPPILGPPPAKSPYSGSAYSGGELIVLLQN